MSRKYLRLEGGNGLCVDGVSKRFGDVEALKKVSVDVRAGEFFTLLGPSGCGKTTLLRIIAGLELPDEGKLYLNGEDITSLPAARRSVNTVFQSYALFPHLKVYENVIFGLKSRKFPEEEIKARAIGPISMLGLEGLMDRYPSQLSGGQKQRVALARALVNEPDVLLLDEPMSALDAKLRTQVQVELKQLQRKLNRTFILVTHDQNEALVVSDRIAVMRGGQIIQSGTPKDVYEEPGTRFVAEFLGAANLLKARKVKGGVETPIGFLAMDDKIPWETGVVAIRPEWIEIRRDKPKLNGVRAKVREAIYRGESIDLWMEPGPLRVRAEPHLRFKTGDEVWLELAPEELVVLHEE